MHAQVFARLVDELRELEHENSGFVSLEEQLAIFHYMSVTGPTIRHVGHRVLSAFERDNITVCQFTFGSARYSCKVFICPILHQLRSHACS